MSTMNEGEEPLTGTAMKRDLDALIGMGLVVRTDEGYSPNSKVLELRMTRRRR